MDETLLRRYRSPEGAAAYRRKYDRSWVRRLSNHRELGLVAAALRRAGPVESVLDCPNGAGRLVPTLLDQAAKVVGADVSRAMVAQSADAWSAHRKDGRLSLLAASASALPFADNSFDVVVCHRLIHHVPEPEIRAVILGELARVARRAVILSFGDASTRKARRRLAKGSGAAMLRPEELAREAGNVGLELEPPVLRIGGWVSFQAVALLRVKEPRA